MKKLLLTERNQIESILIKSSRLFVRQNHGVSSCYDSVWYCLSLFNNWIIATKESLSATRACVSYYWSLHPQSFSQHFLWFTGRDPHCLNYFYARIYYFKTLV
ncbi:hypothetical protein [Legionella pneumophila]